MASQLCEPASARYDVSSYAICHTIPKIPAMATVREFWLRGPSWVFIIYYWNSPRKWTPTL